MVEMRAIVETYTNVNKEDIRFDLVSGVSAWETIEKILEGLKTKFWEIPIPVETYLYYDSATFDIDKDGVAEACTMRRGYTSGLFTFIFEVREAKSQNVKYSSRFYSPVFDLSFVKGEDGIMRVQGVTQGESPKTYLFDISIVGGNVWLTETQSGVPIGELQIN